MYAKILFHLYHYRLGTKRKKQLVTQSMFEFHEAAHTKYYLKIASFVQTNTADDFLTRPLQTRYP